jgi:hypothetical protein
MILSKSIFVQGYGMYGEFLWDLLELSSRAEFSTGCSILRKL